jgi:hypothetical protein
MVRGRVANGWVRAVDADVPDADLGRLVRQGLAESKTNVPMPNFRAMDPSTDPLLVAAGVKTYVGYARSAREVGVDLDDKVPGLRLTPTLNSAREGWVSLDEFTLSLDQRASDDQLGAGVRTALALSIGWPGRIPPSWP